MEENMNHIRMATSRDIPRIAEILVFVKRMNFFHIFRDEQYSFNELTVLSVARELEAHPQTVSSMWVYDDGVVKGVIHVSGKEIKTLYVDHFFQSEGIGGKLLEFAVERFDVNWLWALEKNARAIEFYKRHGFRLTDEWVYEEDTTEKLLKMKR